MKLSGGAEYVRVDLHSHSIADKQFKNEQWKSREEFVDNYITQLEKQNIKIVAITNHNKFDREEYCMLREKGRERDILILPGVEISTIDGKRECIFFAFSRRRPANAKVMSHNVELRNLLP